MTFELTMHCLQILFGIVSVLHVSNNQGCHEYGSCYVQRIQQKWSKTADSPNLPRVLLNADQVLVDIAQVGFYIKHPLYLCNFQPIKTYALKPKKALAMKADQAGEVKCTERFSLRLSPGKT